MSLPGDEMTLKYDELVGSYLFRNASQSIVYQSSRCKGLELRLEAQPLVQRARTRLAKARDSQGSLRAFRRSGQTCRFR